MTAIFADQVLKASLRVIEKSYSKRPLFIFDVSLDSQFARLTFHLFCLKLQCVSVVLFYCCIFLRVCIVYFSPSPIIISPCSKAVDEKPLYQRLSGLAGYNGARLNHFQQRLSNTANNLCFTNRIYGALSPCFQTMPFFLFSFFFFNIVGL